jgi:sortase A
MTTTVARPRRRRRSVGTLLGAVLIVAGLLVGLYGAYLVYFSDLIAEPKRTEIAADWRAGLEDPGDGVGTRHREDFPVVEGDGILGLLHVPRWGEDYAVPIGSGDGPDVLDTGQLGHYPGTQPIGALGNAGLAGHRTSHGMPLREVHQLQEGDAIVVESADAWLVYRMVARDIVKPHQSEVLDPIPPFEGATQGRYLTLTTCDPIYGITERFIVWAEADYWTPKSEGLPPALE